MAVVAGISVGGGRAEVEFVTNGQGQVTTIWIRNSTPLTVRVIISAASGYSLDSEFVLTAPISINVPKPRQFADDNTATVSLRTTVRSV